MGLLHRKPYRVRTEGRAVFVKWLKPITQWSPSDSRAYLDALSQAVRPTVDPEAWALVSNRKSSEDPGYKEYVEKVRGALIDEYGLHGVANEVVIALYHAEMLVLSFPAQEDAEYPYYYRGVQLKPYKKAPQPN